MNTSVSFRHALYECEQRDSSLLWAESAEEQSFVMEDLINIQLTDLLHSTGEQTLWLGLYKGDNWNRTVPKWKWYGTNADISKFSNFADWQIVSSLFDTFDPDLINLKFIN